MISEGIGSRPTSRNRIPSGPHYCENYGTWSQVELVKFDSSSKKVKSNLDLESTPDRRIDLAIEHWSKGNWR